MSRPALNLDDAMPLPERPAYLGVLKVFQQVAEKYHLHYVDLWADRSHKASAARRELALRLADEGQRTGVIGWMLGTSPSHTCLMLRRARVDRVGAFGAS